MRPSAMRRRTWLPAVLAAVLAGTGCAALPVGGEDGWTVTATFEDALNLADGAVVKAGGVPVGKVTGIEAADYAAQVTMRIRDGVELPEGTDFRLRYTTALGEVYVDATPAAQGPALADGVVLSAAETSVAPTVEDTLASASLLINGGSLTQVQTIASELNNALDGRVGATKGLLRELNTFLDQALRSTAEIDRILNALASASETLDSREETINRALKEIRPAAKTLADNTDNLATLLHSTDRVARTTNDLLVTTRADLTLIVDELGPVLDTVNGIEKELVAGLDVVNGFAAQIDHAVPTEFLNLYFKLRVESLLQPTPGTDPGPGNNPGTPGTPVLPGLPLPGVELPTLPQLPILPGIDGVVGGLLGGVGGALGGGPGGHPRTAGQGGE